MTAVEECRHGGDPDLCPPCQRAAEQGRGPAAPRPPRRVSKIAARWVSNCPSCSGLILVGDTIGRVDPDDPYVCADCLEVLA